MPPGQYPTPKPPITWTYADQTARLAATGFAPADVGKFALQLSDATVWRLADDSPITWGEEPNGPRFAKFREMPKEWPGTEVKVMKDGGANYRVPTTTPVRKFELSYKKVSEEGSDWLEMVDDLWDEALGVALGFPFRVPSRTSQAGELLNDVHFESFDRDHGAKFWQRTVNVVLIKRPTG